MTEQKICVRCNRAIDRYARMCVYCNWDQASVPPPQPEIASGPAYVPPPDHRARNRLIGIVALAVALILAFVIGTLIHGFEPSEAKAAPTKEPAQAQTPDTAPGPRSNVTLVPVNDSTPASVEQPVTSAPPQAPGQEASDATALPSDQYASVAAKAKAQKAAQERAEIIDPRTLRGRAYDEEQAPKAVHNDEGSSALPVPQASASGPVGAARTEAFPEYKPLPEIRVREDTQAKLALTVSSDGRVTNIEVLDPVPGATARIIDAVQNWRFRPATINGTPVPANVTVTITLRANE